MVLQSIKVGMWLLTRLMKPFSEGTDVRRSLGRSAKVTRAPSTPGAGKYFSLAILNLRQATAGQAFPLYKCAWMNDLFPVLLIDMGLIKADAFRSNSHLTALSHST